ncbi:MAG: DUF423 domain-containing protein [Deltaproteobacteria bacterium]|nr:DUF423 domain-containing protein [Deltaproteobacteria bacterium]
MARIWVMISGVSGGLAVGLGAFGAHGLKAVLSAPMMSAFETGNRYHMFHTLALLGTSAWMDRFPAEGQAAKGLGVVAGLFAGGMVLFSGSLYVMAVTGWTWLGMATPFGGLAWIVAWGQLVWVFARLPSR